MPRPPILRPAIWAVVTLLSSAAWGAVDEQNRLVFEGRDGPGKGKVVVFLTGDEEYRSEEGLPMLAKILSQRHGFTCYVLFSLDPDGTIAPDPHDRLSGADAL